MTEAVRGGVAAKTEKKYQSAGQRYFAWATKAQLSRGGLVPCPNGPDLAFFSVAEARRGSSPGHIEASVSGVCWCYQASGFPNPGRDATGRAHWVLPKALRGIKRTLSKEKRTRRPITPALLADLMLNMGKACPDLSSDDLLAYKAALTHAVFGLLRSSEFCCDKVKSDDVWDARGSDVQLGKSSYQRVIRRSKADVFGKSATISIYETGTANCPMGWMRAWLDAREAPFGAPLFKLNDNGGNITGDRLSAAMRSCLGCIGLSPEEYAPHSLRKGGAVALSAAGYGKEAICKFGRWSSGAYLGYLELSDAMRAAACAKMARAHHSNVSAEDLATYANRYD